MTFDEIEDCFPEGSHAAIDEDGNETGYTLVSAQWLHDFAKAVEAKSIAAERAVSDRLLEALKDAAADLRGYENVEDSAQRDRLIAEVEAMRAQQAAMRKEKPE